MSKKSLNNKHNVMVINRTEELRNNKKYFYYLVNIIHVINSRAVFIWTVEQFVLINIFILIFTLTNLKWPKRTYSYLS